MNVKKLIGINNEINNVFQAPLPYWRAFQSEDFASKDGMAKKMVIFFGNDFGTVINIKIGVTKDPYITKTNECLDFVRRKYKNCNLYYKPHPADGKEQSFLNLSGFNLVKEKTTAELFLWNNLNRIKAAFSIGSFSSFSAYSMGLNSHVFYKCFSEIYQQEYIWNSNDVFFEMPQSFFITDLDREAIDNSRILNEDEILKTNLKDVLDKNPGKVWLICPFSESIVTLIAMAKIIKDLAPIRRVGLIINRHHRWDKIDTDFFKSCFDEIVFVPRIFYSLKPGKLLKAIKTAWQIKNFKIFPGDILISASFFPEFVENCFISYHKKNLSIGILMNRDFHTQYNSQNLTYTKNNDFRFNKATWFYNKIFEPLLGLNRTLYMVFGRNNGFYIGRYQKPLNEVFGQVIILKASSPK